MNQTLDQFERQTSDQILVAIFPKMESNSSVEDYAVRIFRAWKPGLKGTNNAAVLFVSAHTGTSGLDNDRITGLKGRCRTRFCKQISVDNGKSRHAFAKATIPAA